MPEYTPRSARFTDYLELTKPRLSLLSVLTALAGYLASRPPFLPLELLCVVLGTSLAAGGVATLNQWLEHDTDARMKRTADRPIPTGKVATGSAFVLGGLMCVCALALIFAELNGMAALFTLLTIVAYLGWYTPAKRTSRWSTEIGAVAGALPPLIGWSAGEGGPTTLGWVLFGVLFFWQIPHFLAVSWIYRSDYAAVRFPILPVRDGAGTRVAAWALASTILLVAVSLVPVPLRLLSPVYGAVAAAAGAWMLFRAAAFVRSNDRDTAARRLFLASLAYLPLTLCALVVDRMANF
jgi:protoheme IX farnesyltransferase